MTEYLKFSDFATDDKNIHNPLEDVVRRSSW